MTDGKKEPKIHPIMGYSTVTIISYSIALLYSYIDQEAWNGIFDYSQLIKLFILVSLFSITYSIVFPSIINYLNIRKVRRRDYDNIFLRIFNHRIINRRLNFQNEDELRVDFVNKCRQEIIDYLSLKWYNKWKWDPVDRKILDNEEFKIINLIYLISSYFLIALYLLLQFISNNFEFSFSLIISILLFISIILLIIPIYYGVRQYQLLLLINSDIINEIMNELDVSVIDLYEERRGE